MVFNRIEKRIERLKEKVVYELSDVHNCIYCGSNINLLKDISDDEVFFCFECAKKSLIHDEMVYEGLETSPDVGD
ncbi:hypothetical protein JXR93_00675 [bacterium]|nr:hypothetical protein [bacterium]